jgi:type IV pilus assembly protein PilE
MKHCITMHPPCRPRGFTLIELMITVAIIALVSAIAFPSYTSFIARGKRADARGQLMQAAQFMQRFYSANDNFANTRSGQTAQDAMPSNLQRAPADGVQQYSLTVSATTSAYTLTMAPLAGTAMANDPCGSFIVTSTGVRDVTGATKSRDECWK